jgi:hypothetical protein
MCPPVRGGRSGRCGSPGLLLASLARAQVIPFVDNYQTNVSANTTPETHAAIALADDQRLWQVDEAGKRGSSI